MCTFNDADNLSICYRMFVHNVCVEFFFSCHKHNAIVNIFLVFAVEYFCTIIQRLH